MNTGLNSQTLEDSNARVTAILNIDFFLVMSNNKKTVNSGLCTLYVATLLNNCFAKKFADYNSEKFPAYCAVCRILPILHSLQIVVYCAALRCAV